GAIIALLGRGLGLPTRSALLLGAAMAQVGEFSFILAEDGLELGLIDGRAYNIVLGTAVVSILAGSFATHLIDRLVPRLERLREGGTSELEVPQTVGPARLGTGPPSRTELALDTADDSRRSVVVLGAGRIGGVVIRAVRRRGFRCVVVDRDPRRLEEAAQLGATTFYGDAARVEILKQLGLDRAQVLVLALNDPLTARLATERALKLNPRLAIAARARGLREIDGLRKLGATRISDPEVEASFELARHALQRMGVSGPELTGIVSGLRRDVYGRDRG
ncbi:MAG: NAD-binding protein, partial [Candidatus Limnocylindrales bacterium]